MLTDLGRPPRLSLTLAQLDAHDPDAAKRGREWRYLCPLPACAGHQVGSRHRSLAVDPERGLWICHRCRGGGRLLDVGAPQSRRERATTALRRAFAGSAQVSEPTAAGVRPDGEIRHLRALTILPGTPGERYLAARGIPLALADRAGVRYCPTYFGRPAVCFPVRDQTGRLIALTGRFIDGGTEPKAQSDGPKSKGVFAPLAGLSADPLVVVEGPFDALSLAVCGVPSISLDGTAWPEWLPTIAAFQEVWAALDNDEPGDEASARLTAQLQAYGARVSRLRPRGSKDWNDVLMKYGSEALRRAVATQIAASQSRHAGANDRTPSAMEPGMGQSMTGPGLTEKASLTWVPIQLPLNLHGEWTRAAENFVTSSCGVAFGASTPHRELETTYTRWRHARGEHTPQPKQELHQLMRRLGFRLGWWGGERAWFGVALVDRQ